MAERLNAPVSKTGVPARAPGVQIPLSPPLCSLSTSSRGCARRRARRTRWRSQRARRSAVRRSPGRRAEGRWAPSSRRRLDVCSHASQPVGILGRGDRAAEGARLESVCTGNRTAGSNPALSAIRFEARARKWVRSPVVVPFRTGSDRERSSPKVPAPSARSPDPLARARRRARRNRPLGEQRAQRAQPSACGFAIVGRTWTRARARAMHRARARDAPSLRSRCVRARHR